MLTQDWVKESDAQLLFHINLIPLGLNADLRRTFILRDNVYPAPVAFFGHGAVLIK